METLTFDQLEQEFKAFDMEEKLACVRAYVLSDSSEWKEQFEHSWELEIDVDLILQSLAPHGENAVEAEELQALYDKIEDVTYSSFANWQNCGPNFTHHVVHTTYYYLHIICMERTKCTLTTEELDSYFLKFVLFLTLESYASKFRCDMSSVEQLPFFMPDLYGDKTGKYIDKHYTKAINNPKSTLGKEIKLNLFYRELYLARERAMEML